MEQPTEFSIALKELINEHSMENHCDMPDYILADMLESFIISCGVHLKRNLDWHGCDSVCHPDQSKNIKSEA